MGQPSAPPSAGLGGVGTAIADPRLVRFHDTQIASPVATDEPQEAQIGSSPEDTFLACLSDLRRRYIDNNGLRGSLHFEPKSPGLDVPESTLRSILEHLVEGALRENPSRDPFCHVGIAQRDNDFVTLYVRDNGHGLPECSLDVLRRFIREAQPNDVPERVYRLLLADNLVQWLGGRTWISATPNANGTSVFLRLPRENAAKQS